MKCIKCNKSIDEVMLHRAAPIGQTPPDWMCMPCIKSVEPELANNIKEDKVLSDFDRIFYPKKQL